ncbi:hypothetical protein HanXRQr2_Chr15g0674751 [Helianthus annuus]|uniref:Hydroxyproline-rich glycoprotein family protein n=1 Tax=Helianthus annuus TaxID=4232 RepID=A0A251S518_HELAN|nr:protein PELPK1 [Helianthus annuus]KAF5762957.1 hypothetical protein HanXRQr2_Chr15g0674751 [Helianthus annuus]KAJ0449945.1 putative protein PELPK [Helianthus annuus]KAJ0829767.1 hypothetical protein HanPSC8_Chr15g0647551 [Helianthus annuus]
MSSRKHLFVVIPLLIITLTSMSSIIVADARNLLEIGFPDIPKPELPDFPEIPKPELPHLPEIPKPELPDLPEIPKPELPHLPSLEVPDLTHLPVPKFPDLPNDFPIPTEIP